MRDKQDLDDQHGRIAALEEEVAALSAQLTAFHRSAQRESSLLSDARRRLEDAHGRELILNAALKTGAGSHDLPAGDGEEDRPRVDPALLRDIFAERPEITWGDPAWGLPPLKVPPGLGNYGNLGQTLVSVGVSLLGLNGEGHDRIITMFTQRQRHDPKTAALFITDHDDFTRLRKERFAFEYLPPYPGAASGVNAQDWNQHLRDRARLLWAKWDLKRILTFDGKGT